MTMEYGTITGRLVAAVADTTDDPDVNPDIVPISGTVTFTPSVKAILVVSEDITVVPAPIVAALDANGYVSLNGVQGVTVLATNSTYYNPTGWTYRVSFDNLSANGRRVTFDPYNIEVPVGANVDLSFVTPITGSTGTAIVRGPKGDKGDTGATGPQGDSGPSDTQVATYFTSPSSTRTAADSRYIASSPGYDIVLALGQSNMAGRGAPFSSATDPVHPSIFQFPRVGSSPNTIQPASEPLLMPDSSTGMGPALQFSRWYASRRLLPNRRVLIVPAAYGGTPLSSTATLGWRRGVSGNLYERALTQAQAALAAAGTGSRIVAALWIQGETDGDNGTTGTQYQSDFDALITGLRSDLAIPDLPFIIGTMVPEYLNTGTRFQINTVHRDTPNRLARTDVAVSAVNMNNGDGNHFNGPGQRFNGKALFDAYERVTSGLLAYSETPAPVTAVKVFGLPSAAQAYSLRKVSDTAYTGKAVNVRRSSDNTTTDIGFSSGALDTAALLAFAGSGDAFVATWYDQSGNARDIVQSVTAAQPKIVAAGALITSGGKPAVTFDGVDDCLVNSAPALFAAGAATSLQVLSAAGSSTQSRVWSESVSTSSSGQYGLMQPDGATTGTQSYAYPLVSGAFAYNTAGLTPTLAFYNGAIHQGSGIDTGTTMSSWVDGVADVSGFAYSRPSSAKDRFTLGGVTRSGSLAPKAMTFSELVTFPRALSDADRQTAAANQKSFYGTP